MDGLLERIIAEVERLKGKYYKCGEESDAAHDGNGMYWGGVLSCLNEISTFLNSLKESACIYNRSIEERERCCKYCSAACQARIMK